MKTLKRMMSLTLALVMCAALCTAAFASEAEVEPEPEPESEQVLKVIYGDDVIIKVTRATKKAAPLMLPLSISNSDAVENALASPKASHTFRLLDGAGTECWANVYNDTPEGGTTEMKATFSVTVNGKTSTDTEIIPANDGRNFFAISQNGKDLVGKAVTTVQALNANSVRYTYTIRQKY